MEKLEFGADYLALIDVLSDDELQTGIKIEENISDCINQEQSNFSCERYRCKNAGDVISIFKKIELRLSENDEIPCIHIEGHGSKDGLSLPDGFLMKWSLIFSEFRKINIRSKNNLFFSSGACLSAYAFKEANSYIWFISTRN